MKSAVVALALLLCAVPAAAQGVSYTGFLEGRGFFYPQEAPNDSTRIVGDFLFRNELTLRAESLQFVVGVDLRANSHDWVEDEWRLDVEDRGIQRPPASLRLATAIITHKGFTLDLGKQFIRWGRADIIYPTDRFAPRDYLNVVNSELLPIIGARAALQVGSETFEGVWVPQFTPSRLPLLDQRWAVIPPEAAGLTVQDGGSVIPEAAQLGARWRHTGSRIETAVSFFDGFNHQPDIAVSPGTEPASIQAVRVFPSIRMWGGDVAIPTPALTLKGEVAYVTSTNETSDDYVLYVVEIERQIGEWLIDVGYAGEHVRVSRVPLVFAPDRNMAKSIIGRAGFTVDPTRTLLLEGAIRQSGDGFYGKIEYSQGMGEHWRLTLTGVGIGGDLDDFLGQYRRNSHGAIALRYSF